MGYNEEEKHRYCIAFELFKFLINAKNIRCNINLYMKKESSVRKYTKISLNFCLFPHQNIEISSFFPAFPSLILKKTKI